MAEFKDANTRDSVSNYFVRIADAICGKEETPYTGPQDRYRHALERLALYYEAQAESGDTKP